MNRIGDLVLFHKTEITPESGYHVLSDDFTLARVDQETPWVRWRGIADYRGSPVNGILISAMDSYDEITLEQGVEILTDRLQRRMAFHEGRDLYWWERSQDSQGFLNILIAHLQSADSTTDDQHLEIPE